MESGIHLGGQSILAKSVGLNAFILTNSSPNDIFVLSSITLTYIVSISIIP